MPRQKPSASYPMSEAASNRSTSFKSCSDASGPEWRAMASGSKRYTVPGASPVPSTASTVRIRSQRST